jgi:hypothetical protein
MKEIGYMVRLRDSHIFEVDESNGCYRSYACRNITDSEGNRPQAQSHFTFENLLNYDFIPIDESEIPKYKEKHQLYLDYVSWAGRPDGHGGSKGGTMEEFLNQRK